MAPRRTKTKAGGFDRLPFEVQKEIFQYVLVAGHDHTLRPEERHSKKNERCFPPPPSVWLRRSWFPGSHGVVLSAPSEQFRKPCYHETLNTQVLYVSKDVHAVAVQVLYGCNRFHFSAASLFNKFTDTINPLGVQSLRYLAINFPTCRSFQVASLRRIVMGAEILNLQTLELNMRNENKHGWYTEKGPSAAAEKFVDLLEGRRETKSVSNNEILFAIKGKFDVNIAGVVEQLSRAAGQAENGQTQNVDEYCLVKLTRKSK